MLLLNGKPFNPHASFEHDGVTYPANWFTLASASEKAALGITEVPDPVRPDDRFFYVQENADGTFTSVPKDLEPIKAQFKESIDVTCGNIRAGVVSKGLFVEEEYRVAYDEAAEFKAAGYTGAVPPSVQTWADVSNNTAVWAADDIIATRNQYVSLLNSVRDLRLKSKAAVDAATTSDELLAAFDVFNQTVATF